MTDARRPFPVRSVVVAVVAALVALLGWRAWTIDRELEAQAAARSAAATAPKPVSLPYGQLVSNPRRPPAPPLSLPTADGAAFDLAGARGQVVFVNFWATWCPPCAKEMPSMVKLGDELARKHPGKFKMVAVSVDESLDLVKQFFAQPGQGGRLPPGVAVAWDPNQSVTQAFYCVGRGACAADEVKFPESYIVDREGRIAAYVVGDRDWSGPDARQFLELLIGG